MVEVVVEINYHVFSKDDPYTGSRAFYGCVDTYTNCGDLTATKHKRHITKQDRITPSRAKRDVLEFINNQLKTKYLNAKVTELEE